METYDLVINNGKIIDPGSSFEGKLNIGIKSGKISTLSTEKLSGRMEIDANNQTVTPGFIDIHAHPDGNLQDGINLATYGVTTAIGGNCGSLINITEEEYKRLLLESTEDTYDQIQYKSSLDVFLNKIDTEGYPINLGMLAGDWYLRLLAGADDKEKPATKDQIQKISSLADEAMQMGAFGVSFGLAYAPGIDMDELEALFEVAALHDGLAAVHQRYEGVAVPGYTESAIAGEIELIQAARKTCCKLQISHIGHQLSFASTPYDRLLQSGLNIVEQAREEGLDIMADSFPFAGSGCIISDKIVDMIFSPQFFQISGKNPEEFAYVVQGPHRGDRLTFALLTELRQTAPNTPLTFLRYMKQDLLLRSFLPSWVMVCSDSGLGWTRPAQPAVLGNMVREMGMLSWMDALEKMTIIPARRLGLKNKGRIMAGGDADLVIFDEKRIGASLRGSTIYDYDPEIDDKDAEELTPEKTDYGISCVIINGEVVIKDGVYQNTRSGKALRHQN